ncbi:MAG: MBL fold metallo-hydrolase [Gammaproteobacteria bacterium]|nr:MBL fold metallo-hydrolase [Gammaproteobacteria bacterium]
MKTISVILLRRLSLMAREQQVINPAKAQSQALSVESLYTSDKTPDSMLYDTPQQIADGVWSAIGVTAPARYENSGHNNNLSFIITSDGVLVVNAGANYLLAKALHAEIMKITSQAVRYVVLENAQGHAMLGSNYWKEQGAQIIAHVDAANEISTHGQSILEKSKFILKDKMDGTQITMPDKTFSDKLNIEMGDQSIELINLDPAHSPGNIIVWLIQKRLVISGDLAFHQRMLPLFEHSDSTARIKAWDKLTAFNPAYLIPGPDAPGELDMVTGYTRDQLGYLRQQVALILENNRSLADAYTIDQAAYVHLSQTRAPHTKRCRQVFQSTEFE